MPQPTLLDVDRKAHTRVKRLAADPDWRAAFAARFQVHAATCSRLASGQTNWTAGTLVHLLRWFVGHGRIQQVNEVLSRLLNRNVRLIFDGPDDIPPLANSREILQEFASLGSAYGSLTSTLAKMLEDGVVTAMECQQLETECDRVTEGIHLVRSMTRGAVR